jgi:DNA repair protein RecO
MNLEGIIIHKTPYKDRDLIAKLLLRCGKVINLYFYGGRGGGKHNKGSILELGYMLKVTLAPRRKAIEQNIKIAKEWKLIWDAGHLRADFHGFYYLSFLFEIAQMISLEYDSNDADNDEHAGVFNIISNSIFYLDKSIETGDFDLFGQAFLMLAKLNFQLGILPNYNNCQFCNIDLDKVDLMQFDPQNGGFTCKECLLREDQSIQEGKSLFNELKSSSELRVAIKFVMHLKFSEYNKLMTISRAQTSALFNYFCYQFNFQPSHFKTWSVISKL